MKSFEEANKTEHKVENQWHYKFLTKYGFEPQTKIGIGFVRSYIYFKNEHKITCTTGVNADYWEDKLNGAFGYWADLEPHLKKLIG